MVKLTVILICLLVSLRATAAYFSDVTVTNFPATQAVTQSGSWTIDVGNIAGTISLPTGASTSANQVTANGYLLSIDNKLTGPIPVSQSGAWNITNITGTVSLPTGAATAANQTTIIGHVDGIEGLLSTISGYVDGIESLLTSIFNGANTFIDKHATGSLIAGDTTTAVQIVPNGAGILIAQFSGTWAGSTIVECTARTTATDFVTQNLYNNNGSTVLTAAVANGIYRINSGGFTFCRARRTVATSGTVDVDLNVSAGDGLVISTSPNGNNNIVAAIQSGTWTVQPGNTQNTTPWLVTQKGSFANITTATTKTHVTGAGILKRICLNTNGGNGNTITLYDNTAGSGSNIALITTSGGSVPGNCGTYDLAFTTGLTTVTTGTSNWTVVWE